MKETNDGTKFGSAYKAKRYDSYHAGDQPSKDNANSHAESVHHGEEKDEKTVTAPAEDKSGVDTPSATVEAHGPAHTIVYSHDHEGSNHTVTSHHDDGHQHESAYKSPAEAFQAGGELSAADVKRMDHPDQQGAKSEEDGFEMPDLA